MAMPDIVVQALALALRYLRQFGLEKVLRLGASFRSFSGHSEMSLSPNALRQLEVTLFQATSL
jgi:DNA mismatch repair protein MSH3